MCVDTIDSYVEGGRRTQSLPRASLVPRPEHVRAWERDYPELGTTKTRNGEIGNWKLEIKKVKIRKWPVPTKVLRSVFVPVGPT